VIRPAEVLAAYDFEVRRDPSPYPEDRIERVGPVVRVVGKDNYVIFSDLTDENAPLVVAEQAEFFRRAGVEAEWKWFGHDRPAGLPALLERHGFVPEEPETLVVFDLADGLQRAPTTAGLDVRRVTDERTLDDAAAANRAAFGRDEQTTRERWTRQFRDPTQALFVAYLDGTPVSSGRLDLPSGGSFAGLYGGGTSPEYRRRGAYRSLVRARAALASERGYRYLTVDARETSRPILERLGFVPLTTTRAYVLRPPK
jgi:ribosomal protein S18 acetylase RimI-like enzyme